MNQSKDIQNCIETCWQCRHECQTAFFSHCLEAGGEHLAPDHVKLMMDCIQICQVAADAMVRQSPQHAYICEACASICEACAKSCEEIGGEMAQCAEICRKCAESCRNMSKMKKAA